jgi:hypothetical protein
MLLGDHEVHSVAMVKEDDGRPHEHPIVGYLVRYARTPRRRLRLVMAAVRPGRLAIKQICLRGDADVCISASLGPIVSPYRGIGERHP